MIMENCLRSPLQLHEVYDLKGSTINRSVPEHFRTSLMVAMKDLDFKKNKREIVVGKYTKYLLMKQIEDDVQFLHNNNIVDYSLLVAIHFGDKPDDILPGDYKKSYKSIFQRNNGGIRTNLDSEVYFYIGIIDILTQWDVSKISEYGYKTLFLSQDKKQLSAVNPKLYAKRFLDFMNSIIQ
jgi:1-phosphatidylinositol-4-phosphate 5-kinase